MPESRNARCLSYSASKYGQGSSVMFRLACKDLRVPASFLMVPVLELGVKKQCVCVFKTRHGEFVERFVFSHLVVS